MGDETSNQSRVTKADTMTYNVTVTFTVDPNTDEHLQSEQGIEDEFHSWLEGLKATVETVTVHQAEGAV